MLFAILLAALGIAQAQMSFPDITQAAAAIERVFGTIDRQPGIGMNEEGVPSLPLLSVSMRMCVSSCSTAGSARQAGTACKPHAGSPCG